VRDYYRLAHQLRRFEGCGGHQRPYRINTSRAERGEKFSTLRLTAIKRNYRRLCFPDRISLGPFPTSPASLPPTEYTALLRGDSQATARTTHVGYVIVFEATPPLCLHSRVLTVTIVSAHSLVPQSWVANYTDQLLINLGCLSGAGVPFLYPIILVLALACAWPGCHLGCHVAGPARR
jgi:hypothetical protein